MTFGRHQDDQALRVTFLEIDNGIWRSQTIDFEAEHHGVILAHGQHRQRLRRQGCDRNAVAGIGKNQVQGGIGIRIDDQCRACEILDDSDDLVDGPGFPHYGDYAFHASRVQHKADEQIRTNLRKVAEDVDWLVKTQRVHFLVLAGKSEVTSELREMLPKRLALLVVGAIDLAIDSSPKDVFDAVSVVNEQHERDTEIQMVKEVVTAAAKKRNAVAGFSHTLNAVNQGRVWQLIYADGLASPGFECRECTRPLLSNEGRATTAAEKSSRLETLSNAPSNMGFAREPELKW